MPITSALDVWNLALSHLGSGKEVASLTERSEEARACTRFYEVDRDATLAAFSWGFAKRVGPLTLVATTPTSEWAASYRLPPDAVAFRRLLSGAGRFGGASVFAQDWAQRGVTLPVVPDPPYTLASDDAGTLIYTDLTDDTNGVFAEWTTRVTDVTRFPPRFVRALSLVLSASIAPRVTGGDPTKLRERNLALYVAELAAAEAQSANERQPDPPPDSELVRAR